MARPSEYAIETFMNITGASEPVAVQKLEEYGGDLSEAVNAYFSGGDRRYTNAAAPDRHYTNAAAPPYGFMDAENQNQVGSRGSLFPLLSAARSLNPFSLLDPNFRRRFFNGLTASAFSNRTPPFVSHPGEVMGIPMEDRNRQSGYSGYSGHSPNIEDTSGTALTHGPGVHRNAMIDDDRQEYNPSELNNSHLYGNDIEKEMIQAAIEASKREAEEGYRNAQFGDPNMQGLSQRQHHLEDDEFTRAVSLSLKTAEEEKAMRDYMCREQIRGVHNLADGEDLRKLTTANGRLKQGSSSVRVGVKDAEEQPMVRQRPNHDSGKFPQHGGDAIHSDEWGGISSEEHDEAVRLEAVFFGGIPEGTSYYSPYGPHPQTALDRSAGPNPRPVPLSPSPSLTAQRLLREQQDDEYLASLRADREKEMKAAKEAETHLLNEGESFRKVLEEEELERRLAAKEASLPQEPPLDDENAVTLLVRMPDGGRRGRRFLKCDKLQSLFDYIDVGKAVNPGTYRVVRPFPRRAFSVDDSSLSLNELGLTSKQEALFLELI